MLAASLVREALVVGAAAALLGVPTVLLFAPASFGVLGAV